MEEPTQLRRALLDVTAGAISGGISRTVTSPLDVIKIRFQVQLEPTTSLALLRRDLPGSSKYTGMSQATKDILREEGLPLVALFVNIFLSVWCMRTCLKLYSFTYGHAIYRHTIFRVAQIENTCFRFFQHSGGLAGCAATVGSYPFDLLRTILASQGEPKVYPNMRSAFFDIVSTRGFRGLYAGLSPTLIEIIPYAGLQFGTYDTFKRWTMAWNRRSFNTSSTTDSLSSFQLFICGLAAGTCAKLVCHPLDVVKKRFQIEGLQRHPKYGARVDPNAYKNMFDALGRILQSEGWHGLYKGILPSTIKAAPAGAVTFVAYEFTSDWLESIWS
ncbi:hypothetical protein V6N13_037729 [Hibiscus sabdariffa]|uniref:Mitochondrial carrier protein n=1 Tax=Hibiscus sabdariffa TaxID=183260 RepID=A0ABR2S483_9ROSI